MVVPARLKELYTPIPYIFPAQMFTAFFAERKGLDPDRPRTLTKVTRTSLGRERKPIGVYPRLFRVARRRIWSAQRSKRRSHAAGPDKAEKIARGDLFRVQPPIGFDAPAQIGTAPRPQAIALGRAATRTDHGLTRPEPAASACRGVRAWRNSRCACAPSDCRTLHRHLDLAERAVQPRWSADTPECTGCGSRAPSAA